MTNNIYYWIDYQYATKNLYLLYKVNRASRTTTKCGEFSTIEEAEQALSLVENLSN